MPLGIAVMRWDERTGVDLVGTYPGDIQLDEKLLMQIYSTHEYTGEAGLISLNRGASNVASYYTGPEHGLYVLLLLSLDEDPEAYEEGLVEVARHIVQNISKEDFNAIIPNLFRRISIYPTLTEEQKLFMLYDDEVKRTILRRLEDEGGILKSELVVWFKDEYQDGFIDVDAVLDSFIKLNLVKQVSVKGIQGLVVFLIQDILISRTPADKIVKDPVDRGLPESLKNEYLEDVKSFFQNYIPDDEDLRRVIHTIMDPQVYEVLKLLRNAVVTRNVLEKLKKKGVDDIEGTLKALWDVQMITVLQDERGNEYYALKTDVKVKRVFPGYLVNRIRQDYIENLKNPYQLIEHLEILEDSFKKWRETIKAQDEQPQEEPA